MNQALEHGAACLQGYYGIANPTESAFTRLMAVTYVMKNLLYNGGKARLGLSVLLMGTGMVFARQVLEESGWKAMTIGEDLEQTFNLLERGERILFMPDARIRAQEATGLRQGYTQRQRWATGRRALRGRGLRAIARGARECSLTLLDGGIDLLMPSYSRLLNWTAVAVVAGLVLRPWAPGILVAAVVILAYQVFEMGVGLRLMRADLRFVASLSLAPVFLAWKAVIDLLAVFGHRRDVWTRTARQPHSRAAGDDLADGRRR
jgi:cellulose synthase/poly-beta-1,6-N-acetylglucosamine synthase-like glycosyltransferase